ncbi:unannotated protein [freshwater metagenome]|uniref:Unannotated protein n=1 Tax=freshwater metagenome TaxID=449393 RepID=A0A6J6BEE7_9ZZZZ
MRMKRIMTATLIAMLLITTAPVTFAADNNPYGTSTVDPAGPNEVIFKVSKGGREVGFTVSRLLKMKSSTISIYEPFIKKRQTFTVVPMKNFFALAGISGKDKVITTALNDYTYTNTASKFIEAGAFIAIKRNGAEISYDQGGPLRIVFSDKSKWATYLDAWNWSLASFSVK